jgi:hypothetical protein
MFTPRGFTLWRTDGSGDEVLGWAVSRSAKKPLRPNEEPERGLYRNGEVAGLRDARAAPLCARWSGILAASTTAPAASEARAL